MKKIIVAIAIIAAIVLIAAFVPIVEVPYTVTVEYEDTETYYVTEPYDVIETYTVTTHMPMVEIVEHNMKIEYDSLRVVGKVKNTSDITLAIADVSILVSWPYKGLEDRYFSRTATIDAPPAFEPGQVRIFSAICHRSLVEDSYRVAVGRPWRMVRVQEERTVTKYREVQRERTVTKERTETHYKRAPIFEYLFG